MFLLRRLGRRSPGWSGPPLAWLNLVHVKFRLIVAVSAISFTVTLIFIQLGIFSAVLKSATVLYDNLNFDIILVSPKSPEVLSPQPFFRRRLYQAAGVDGVASVMPIYISFREWRNPETKKLRAILLLGLKPSDKAFRLPTVNEQLPALRQQDTVLMNRLSRDEFGPRVVGVKTELGDRDVEIVGLFEMSNTIRCDGTVIMSDQNFIRYSKIPTLDDINLGLITVEPGTDVDAMVESLRNILPFDVDVLSRREAEIRDQNYWVRSTSIGLIITIGGVTALIVGVVIVYQILNADVAEHLHEYATLKAMGYSNLRLSKVVLQESAILTVLGFVPGLFLAFGIYKLIFIATRLPITMTIGSVIFVFLLTLMMCITSGILALRKVLVVDPAEIF
ncbi:MAG: ABC transporter permease DevC [Xenococcaceae cyanobacterium]